MNTTKTIVAAAAAVLAAASIGAGIAGAHVLDRTRTSHTSVVDTPEPGDTPDVVGSVDTPDR